MRAAMVLKQYFSTPDKPVGVREVADLFKAVPRQEYLNMAKDAANQMGVTLEVDNAKTPVVSR